MKSLETERLLLRPFTIDDAEDLHRVVYSDPEVCHFFCGKTRPLEAVRERVAYRAFEAADSDWGFLGVVRKSDQALMGLIALQCCVTSYIRWEDAPEEPTNRVEIELSYALGRDYWRQGYATEAGRAMLAYAFNDLKLPRIAYAVDGKNEPSIALMRTLGFTLSKNHHPNYPDSVVGVLVNPLVR